ncbi:FAD binding domain-containing protein [Alicyclobacillus sp.]|uniref:FAD binding domain-containing protein n=1 Tax=Alicyclobacillus sp. TaxID=61169 RepID=UPI0025C2421A|nr:FAD binding domain-containing protein [Alicyclobacillus sp.]MCL6517566.1 FAD binding domain-containing protein [Alicyclobacillus sp.]
MWYSAKDLAEALEVLSSERPVVVGGGTDLFVHWPRRKPAFDGRHWLDVHRVSELRLVNMTAEGIVIGAAVTAAQLWQDARLNAVPALQQAARVVGGWQIQNRATLGGNIANASPAADMVAALAALDARVEVASQRGTRMERLTELITGPKRTTLEPDELITRIHLPSWAVGMRQVFLRLDQRGGTDISLVSAAVALRVEDDRVRQASIAVGAAGPVPLRLPEADAHLVGVRLGGPAEDVEGVADRIARAYAEAARPITDVRASADYRRAMVEVLVRRGIRRLLEEWKG